MNLIYEHPSRIKDHCVRIARYFHVVGAEVILPIAVEIVEPDIPLLLAFELVDIVFQVSTVFAGWGKEFDYLVLAPIFGDVIVECIR